jgi:hypothetical protein
MGGEKHLAPLIVDLAAAMGMFSTGRRLKKPTEKETGEVDGGIMKGMGSGLGELIVGRRGVSVVSLLSVQKIHLV